MKTSLPESLAAAVKSTIADWQSGGKMKRLWDRDAQARGDFQVLAERGGTALRLHLGKDLKSGLASLQAAIQKAL